MAFSPLIKPGRANVRTTFQLAAHILPKKDDSFENAIQKSREIILEWLRGKFPEPIPSEAYRGDAFECDEHGQKISGVPVPEEGIWSFRLEQPDAPFGGRPAVPGRFWTTDIALRHQVDTLSFGVRVQCASLDYARQPITLTRPRVVLDLARRFQIREARVLDGSPWSLNTFEDLQEFESFILDPIRNMPVVLLTQPDRNRLHVGVSEFLLDARNLAQHLQGFAYVATMPYRLGYHWSDLVGKPWSAYLGAVRTYRPGLDYDQDTPAMHPLTFPEKILLWRHKDDRGEHEGERAFERFLAERIREQAATKRVNWRGCIFVPEARSLRAALLRKQSQDSEDWRSLYEAEITALQEQLKESQEEEKTAEEMAEAAEKERDYFLKENAKLRAHNETIRATLEAQTGNKQASEIALPENYKDLADWVEDSFVGRLELHPRAIRGLKKAVYEDIPLVCHALQLLAREYRNMRLGHEEGHQAWNNALKVNGFEFSGSVAKNRAGEEGDTYFIDYPPHSGSRQFMEFHLRRGNSREPVHCLRIYYLWHEESQQVVVGWLPSHLDTRTT